MTDHQKMEPASLPGSGPPGPAAAAPIRGNRRLVSRFQRAGLAPWLVAGAVLAAAAAGWSLWRTRTDVSAIAGELTYRVPKGDLLISFTERGNVKAAKSVPIYSSVEGSSTIVSVVPEGTFAREGDLLVELDSSELTQLHNQQEIAVETAEADAFHAGEALAIQTSLSESVVREAELKAKLADIDLQKYEQGDYKQALTKSNADKTIAEEELTRARNQYEWTQKLADKGYVTGTELIADRLAVRKAELNLENAKGALEVLEKWTHKKDQEKYQSDLRQAKDALERARRKAKSEIAQAEGAKKAKESTMHLSRRRLGKIADQLEKTKIRAPQDGMVVYNMESWRRERMIEQGAEVRENQLLMNLPDVSTMAVEVQVHESRIDLVRADLPALVSIDALPNLNLKGTVTKVGLLPDNVNRWMNPDLKVYATEITIDSSQDTKLLKPGMSAKVQLIVDVLRNVLYVPVQSVTTIDREQACYVLDGNRFLPRRVQGGKYNESFIEIVSGLAEGDVIQLNAPAPQGSRADEVEEAAAMAAAAKARSAVAGAPEPGERPRRGSGGRDGDEGGERGGGKGSRRERGPRPGGPREEDAGGPPGRAEWAQKKRDERAPDAGESLKAALTGNPPTGADAAQAVPPRPGPPVEGPAAGAAVKPAGAPGALDTTGAASASGATNGGSATTPAAGGGADGGH
jgi:HlyD family secretion protein